MLRTDGGFSLSKQSLAERKSETDTHLPLSSIFPKRFACDWGHLPCLDEEVETGYNSKDV